MAKNVENAVRSTGAIPATCAFVKGKPFVGLTETQLEQMAALKAVNKVSRRDIGVTMAKGLDGGTTIAGTMILSHLADIKVFATGGLGGVHRDGHITMDVSADLTELARTPVSVVCSGPKLILDIARTMEYLETQGVFVATFNDNNRRDVQIPGFFCRDLGVLSPYEVSSWREAASIVNNLNNVMGLASANLFCVPPPEDIALPSDLMENLINEATAKAIEQNILGKHLTPFLLKYIAEATKGRSVECNKNFVINNAVAASHLAQQLLEIERSGTGMTIAFTPSHNEMSFKNTSGPSTKLKKEVPRDSKPNVSATPKDNVDTLIIGLIALDTVSILDKDAHMGDSNPGKLVSSVGGVGYNVSLAHSYSLGDFDKCYRFVSVVGDDFAGKLLLEEAERSHGDISGIRVSSTLETAQYTAILDPKGELLLACADMTIFEQQENIEFFREQIVRAQPKTVILDCNTSSAALDRILTTIRKELQQVPRVIVEPTSLPKLSRIGKINSRNLGVYPNNIISLITPTVSELSSIHSAFARRELFDDYDEWFPALDSLGINSQFREKLDIKSKKHTVLRTLLDQGVLQQCFQVLPYIPNILVKLGEKGAVLVKMSTDVEKYNSIPTTSPHAPDFILLSQGALVEENHVGVVIEYFPIPPQNENLKVVNVTGAGDAFLGILSSDISSNDWLVSEIGSIEQEWDMWKSMNRAQKASGLSIQSTEAISPEIKQLASD